MNTAAIFRLLYLPVLCFLLLGCRSTDNTDASNELLSAFYGTFIGSAESVVGSELSKRELTVEIEPLKGSGFTLNWTTRIYRPSGNNKLTDLSIDFYPSSRPGIFASASRTDMFGRSVPFDPVGVEAAPYIWAGVQENSMIVSALYILDDGGHQLHVYERSIIDEGLLLQFDRLHNGEKVAQVSAVLERVR